METGVVGASGAGKWVRRRGCQAPHSNHHHRHRHLFVIVAVAYSVIVIAIITIFPVIIMFLVVDKMPAQ